MIYLIIGRFASGRHYLANIMKENILPNTNTNEKVMAALSETDIMIQNNILIIPPDHLNTITACDKTEAFAVIHTEADDMDRRFNFVKYEEKKIKAEEYFDSIDESEDAIYNEFELKMHALIHHDTSVSLPVNVTRCYHYVNEYSPSTTKTYASGIIANNAINRQFSNIISIMNKEGLIQGENDSDMLTVTSSDGTNRTVNPSFFAELCVDNTQVFAEMMQQWLIRLDTIDRNTTRKDDVS